MVGDILFDFHIHCCQLVHRCCSVRYPRTRGRHDHRNIPQLQFDREAGKTNLTSTWSRWMFHLLVFTHCIPCAAGERIVLQ